MNGKKKMLALGMMALTLFPLLSTFTLQTGGQPDETPVQVAEKAAVWVISQAISEDGGYKWQWVGSRGLIAYQSNVQWGSAGFGKFFLRLYETTGNSLYLDYAKGAAKWVISKAIPDSGGYKWAHPDDDIPSPGWWLSPTVSGIAEFLLAMYQTTGELIFLDYAKGAAKWLMAMAYWGEPGCFIPYNPPDEYGSQAAHGIAPGREAYTVTFLLHMYQETKDAAYLPYIEGTATWLMTGPDKVAENGGYKWRHGRPYGSLYYPIDGNSRIALFFYEIYRALGKAEYLEYANKAMTWLLSQAIVDGDKAKWPDSQAGIVTLPFAGSFFGGRGEEPRVCDLLMVAYEVTGNVTYLEYAKKLANWVISPAIAIPEGGGYKFPCNEGGSDYDVLYNARVCNFLTWMYNVTEVTSYSEFANGALKWIIYKAEETDGGYKWRTLTYSPYYATWFSGGAAGIGYYLTSAIRPSFRKFSPITDGFGFENPPLTPRAVQSIIDILDRLKQSPITDKVSDMILSWIIYIMERDSKGLCGGMVDATIHYFEHPEMIPDGYGRLVDVPQNLVLETIEDFQIGQFFDAHSLLKLLLLRLGDDPAGLLSLDDEVTWIKQQTDQNKPVKLVVIDPDFSFFSAHAVLAYDVTEEDGNILIKIYGPNKPREEQWIELTRDENGKLKILNDQYPLDSFIITRFASEDGPTTLDWFKVAEYTKTIVAEIIQWIKDHLVLARSSMSVVANSPVNLLVTAPDGLRIGYDSETESVVNEIVYAMYSGSGSEPQVIIILDPLPGNYTVDVYGIGTGNYTITVESTAINGTAVGNLTLTGTASHGKLDPYSVELREDYSVVPEFQSAILLPLLMITTLLTAILLRKRRHLTMLKNG